MRQNRFKSEHETLKRPGWRDYQARLKRFVLITTLTKRIIKYSFFLILTLVGFYLIVGKLGWTAFNYSQKDYSRESKKQVSKKKLIDKNDIQTLLDKRAFVNLKDKSFDLVVNSQKLRVNTSLDLSLQHYLQKKIDRDTSRYVGIVVMDPSTGRVLSMVSFDKTDPSNNPCIDNEFPAASIFKIVTAAAAVEKCGFNLSSKFSYNGRKYTLYKSQLKDKTNKYTNKTTLKDSFAQSVNPVFGKIGANYLGKSNLEEYALAFGFNRKINFEIPLSPSFISLSDDPYQWAEVACGFNHETKISPVHGAVITSAILNQGRMIEPTIVDQIIDGAGHTIYRGHIVTMNRAMTSESSDVVNNLMRASIRSGTCSKIFRGRGTDHILSRLNIGGKTGSIDTKKHDGRYDWFVGFAEEKEGAGKLVISVIVVHEKYIGTRASQYARMAIKEYFRDYFAKNKTDLKRASS
ncbi:MAG: PbpA [Proteobacteria bacterium]|nr:PbpA [Desulfobacteraceae bacterium]MBU3980434.1 PbpA [Pseudomonadota bacterium]MBU4012351.1 PbpA [Pseudomonadota bacterium]MBU4067221.1 PbpA [Pseudomonadota bacterium]MBU4101666.1 PbpA [Pseudomonadota bacterium]